MDPSDQSCPQCGSRYDLDQPPPARCLNCGAELATPPRKSRRLFWLLFFATPLLALGTLWLRQGPILRLLPQPLHIVRFFPQFAAPGILIVGAWGAGYFLARSHIRRPASLIAASIGYAIGILFVYGAVVFVGCLLIASQIKF